MDEFEKDPLSDDVEDVTEEDEMADAGMHVVGEDDDDTAPLEGGDEMM